MKNDGLFKSTRNISKIGACIALFGLVLSGTVSGAEGAKIYRKLGAEGGCVVDTTVIFKIGDKRLRCINGNGQDKKWAWCDDSNGFVGHYDGIDLGLSQLAVSGLSTALPSTASFMELDNEKSINVGINFFQYSFGLQRKRDNFGLVTGLGLNISNYRLSNPYLLKRDAVTGNTVGEAIVGRDIKKNKLVTSSFEIPLLLEYQFPNGCKSKRFFLSAGGFAGVNVGSHTKTVFADSNHKYKERPDLNLNLLQYGLMARMGIGKLSLYSRYQYSTLFEKDKGPELYPFSVGITLSNW